MPLTPVKLELEGLQARSPQQRKYARKSRRILVLLLSKLQTGLKSLAFRLLALQGIEQPPVLPTIGSVGLADNPEVGIAAARVASGG